MRTLFITLSLIIFVPSFLWSINVVDYPTRLIQPNGDTIDCFFTGDEYYGRYYDKKSFTIIQDRKTGYYVYARLENDMLVPTSIIPGKADPSKEGLTPKIDLSEKRIKEFSMVRIDQQNKLKDEVDKIVAKKNRKVTNTKLASSSLTSTSSSPRTINNIILFVRFADQDEFPSYYELYLRQFNSTGATEASLYNYIKEVSYGKINYVSHLLPKTNGAQIISYRDSHSHQYYMEASSSTNPEDPERWTTTEQQIARNKEFYRNAMLFIKNKIPTNIDLDTDNDGIIDRVTVIVRGESWNQNNIPIFWPSVNYFGDIGVTINGLIPYKYTVYQEGHFEANGYQTLLAHETLHTFGAPERYIDNYSIKVNPVGPWDPMSCESYLNDFYAPSPHCSAFIKWRFLGFIDNIPEITTSGTYRLNPLTSPTQNCYKIKVKDWCEYIVIEYRKKVGIFEQNIPGEGLIITRISEHLSEYMLYRYNGDNYNNGDLNKAFFSKESGRSSLTNYSNPWAYIGCKCNPDNITRCNQSANLFIKNIGTCGDQISFDVRFCDDTDLTVNASNQLPVTNNALQTLNTNGNVIVKTGDGVTFEAGNSVTLNGGFEVQKGGVFEINMNECGLK